ncbi:MAG: hypothetical protein WBN29_18215 [Polyangiales bacterium]
MSNANRFRKAVMWLGVIFLLVGGFGSLSAGSDTATSNRALSLASALLLLDLSGKPKPRSAKSLIGFAFLAVAVGAAFVMVYERLSR